MPVARSSPSRNPRIFAGWAVRAVARLLDPIELRLTAGSREPVPPRRLRARAGAGPARAFLEGGRIAAGELAHALSSADRALADVEAVLDLGCGAGRVLPHLAQRASNARCVGCDVDRDAIDWLRRHRPELEWMVTGAAPPLPFDDETFDLLYSISVFSHLDEGQQDQWLSEVSRILRGGGIALLTTHGAYAFEQFRGRSVRTSWVPGSAFEREPLRPDEFLFEPYERSFWNRAELPGVHTAYGLAFHGHRYLRERWSRDLEIVAVHERAMSSWQDIVVARRRA
jgi:SAM-dependent methyltransferase